MIERIDQDSIEMTKIQTDTDLWCFSTKIYFLQCISYFKGIILTSIQVHFVFKLDFMRTTLFQQQILVVILSHNLSETKSSNIPKEPDNIWFAIHCYILPAAGGRISVTFVRCVSQYYYIEKKCVEIIIHLYLKQEIPQLYPRKEKTRK